MSRSARPFRPLGAVLVSAVMALAVAGCGSDDSGSGSGSDSSVVKKDSSGTSTVDITFKGDSVTPSGAKVKVKAGDPLKLHITADKAGEIHVHSSPEQHIEYAAGTTDKTVTIDQPGVVDVESHSLDKLILQLTVR
ncbi:hypothetical protein [Marmoricola sp. URHB0036]|uniref:hypothetical protein n=1 Tax=Marmoricola sp. URHB0036 TaxID=1298863 RepID=UPI00040BDC61|nr:hypothetical protein [Marmoricola sp. URHB0036]